MTKEEAIARIKDHMIAHKRKEPRAIYISEALDMAIKALEQQPCEDYISRQAVKEQMIKYGFHAPDMTVTEFSEDLPSAQPQPVRCKDCKWCENADGLMCKNPASWVVATDRDFGCVLAERRTDGSD